MKRRTRRKHRTANKKRRSHRRVRNKLVAPRTAKQYFATSREFQEFWDHIVQVPAKMRSGKISLQKAAQEFEVSPRQVRRLARAAFRRLRNGRYIAKPIDHLLRILLILSDEGLIEVAVNDSRQASLIGEYWNALHRYLSRGDASELQKFKDKRARDASGKRIKLLTDLDQLGRLASAGVLRFESLYGRTA
jgi:hypothetical protein